MQDSARFVGWTGDKSSGADVQAGARFVGWTGDKSSGADVQAGARFGVCTRRQVQLGGRTEHYNTSEVKRWPQCPFQSTPIMMEWNLLY